MFTHTEERLALLDRCEIYLFSAYRPTLRAYPGSNEAAVATIATTSTRANGKIVGLTEHWVKESLQDICRVMKDCEDTTN